MYVCDVTSSLTSRAEHCRGTDIILCGFHVTELALQLTKTMHHYSKCSLASSQFVFTPKKCH